MIVVISFIIIDKQYLHFSSVHLGFFGFEVVKSNCYAKGLRTTYHAEFNIFFSNNGVKKTFCAEIFIQQNESEKQLK